MCRTLWKTHKYFLFTIYDDDRYKFGAPSLRRRRRRRRRQRPVLLSLSLALSLAHSRGTVAATTSRPDHVCTGPSTVWTRDACAHNKYDTESPPTVRQSRAIFSITIIIAVFLSIAIDRVRYHIIIFCSGAPHHRRGVFFVGAIPFRFEYRSAAATLGAVTDEPPR